MLSTNISASHLSYEKSVLSYKGNKRGVNKGDIKINHSSKESVHYEKIEVSMKSFEKMQKESKDKVESFKKFITDIISYQGNKSKNFKIKIDISVSKEVSSESKEVESPEVDLGEWSAKETSERILDFAKKISGGNPEKVELLRDAFKKGFEQAEELFGGTLPDVSYQTYDLVMEGFDEMENPKEAKAN